MQMISSCYPANCVKKRTIIVFLDERDPFLHNNAQDADNRETACAVRYSFESWPVLFSSYERLLIEAVRGLTWSIPSRAIL